MSEIDLVFARLKTEEGRRARAYNDATGATITCQPGGNLSIAYGLNLEPGLDQDEMDWLLSHRIGKVADQLFPMSWYANLDPARRSVCLDIAYNGGIGDLLHYPHMIAALITKDWAEAKVQCTAANPKLADRYAALGEILLTGVA